MEIFLAIVQLVGPLALIVMGAVVALKPPPRSNQIAIRRWIAAFVIVGLSAFAAGVADWHFDRQERDTAKAEFSKFIEEQTGGRNFAYVRVRSKTSEDGKNWVAIETTGALPSLAVGFYPLSPDGVPTGKEAWLHYADLPKTTFNTNAVLTPGRYRIDFKMGNKSWTEHLDFERSEDGVDQVLWVERDGKVIHREP